MDDPYNGKATKRAARLQGQFLWNVAIRSSPRARNSASAADMTRSCSSLNDVMLVLALVGFEELKIFSVAFALQLVDGNEA
jgi:hypothetical protein